MAQKKGIVKSVSKDGWAMVVTERDDACSTCESAQFCHSLADCSRMETRVLNRADAGIGDRVIISLSASSVFKSAMILYILPTVGLMIGAIGGFELHQLLGINQTGAAIFFGCIGLIMGFTITSLISIRLPAGSKLTPVITRKIKPIKGFHHSQFQAGLRRK